MGRSEIVEELYRLQDREYASFQAKLIPSIDAEKMIGVRTPALRAFAKKLAGQDGTEKFLNDLPHEYFEENQVHAFIVALEKDFTKCMAQTEMFLPYIDNWATCDQFSPKVFQKNPEKLLGYIKKWLASGQTYVVRFAIGMLMQHFLDESFAPEYPEMVANVRSDEYYIKMMIAWYFATALAKQYDLVLPYIERKRLDDWTHNKAIQKSIESYRITPEQKIYLKTLKTSAGK